MNREVADLGFDTGADAASAAAGRLCTILDARRQPGVGSDGHSRQADEA